MNRPLPPPLAAACVGLSVRDVVRVDDFVTVLAAAAAAGLAAELHSTACGRLSVHLLTDGRPATVDAVCAVLAAVGAQVTQIKASPEGDSSWIDVVRDGRQWWAFAAAQPRPADTPG